MNGEVGKGYSGDGGSNVVPTDGGKNGGRKSNGKKVHTPVEKKTKELADYEERVQW